MEEMRAECLGELCELMQQADGPDGVGFNISRDFEAGEWVATVKRADGNEEGERD